MSVVFYDALKLQSSISLNLWEFKPSLYSYAYERGRQLQAKEWSAAAYTEDYALIWKQFQKFLPPFPLAPTFSLFSFDLAL